MRQIHLGVDLSTKRLATAFGTSALIIFLALAGTWCYLLVYPIRSSFPPVPQAAVRYLLVQLHLGVENVLATWFASMLLLLVAIGAFLCFVVDRRYLESRWDRLLSGGW